MRVSAKGAKAAVAAGLVSALVLGGIAPATPAIAAGTASVTVTPGSPAYKVTGDYKVYKLFTGTFFTDAAGKKHMGDVDANPDFKDAVVNALRAVNTNFSLTTSISEDRQAIEITDAIAKLNAVDAQKFANKLAGELSTATTGFQTVAAASNELKVNDLDTGYYLIVGNDGEGAVTSAIVVPVDGAVTATTKASTPTITKQVKMGTDANFVGSTDGGLIEAGKLDSITYKLTGTVSSNIDDFAAYSYSFEDTLPANVSMTDTTDWNVKVEATIGGQTEDITSAFNATFDASGHVVTWKCADLAETLTDAGLADKHGDAEITLTYAPTFSAEQLKNALETQTDDTVAHATNTAKLIYSNNPYDGRQTDTADSAADSAKVYSYQLNISTVGENNGALAGAKFTLKRGDKVIYENVEVAADGKLQLPGLDSGVKYTLVESGVPAGTKSIDPIDFSIGYGSTGDKITEAKAANIKDPSTAATFDADAKFDDNVITVTIKNLDGADLPLTGQQGIVAGVTVGGIVLAVSLVAAVRNRKSNE